MKILCKLGLHKYVETVLIKHKYTQLRGHRCSRCNKLPPEQEFLKYKDGYQK